KHPPVLRWSRFLSPLSPIGFGAYYSKAKQQLTGVEWKALPDELAGLYFDKPTRPHLLTRDIGMIRWIRLIFAPPFFESAPEKTRMAGVIHTIALALATSQLIAVFVPIYGGSAARRHVLSGSAVAISIVVLLLTRRGYVRQASLLIVVGVWS